MKGWAAGIVVLGLVGLGWWLFTYIRDHTGPCPKAEAEAWMASTDQILRSYEAELQSAKLSYERQQGLGYPECVTTLHQDLVNVYYYLWKADEAQASGDFATEQYYVDEARTSWKGFKQEMDRVGPKYGWQPPLPDALLDSRSTNP